LTLYPFLELEVGSVPFGPNFSQLHIGEPSSGFTPRPRSAPTTNVFKTKNINYNDENFEELVYGWFFIIFDKVLINFV
jgi:hypothetical protein